MYCRWHYKHTSMDAAFTQQTCSSSTADGQAGAGRGGGGFLLKKCRLWHSRCWFCLWPSVGFPSTSVWAFDVYEVIVDYPLLSPSRFICASNERQSRERQRLPFISTLIFICDGWLSHCVILFFEKCSLGHKKWLSSQSNKEKKSILKKGCAKVPKMVCLTG